MSFKFSGKIDVKQFREPLVYDDSIDMQLLEIARSIEWYKQNWQTEKKQWQLQMPMLGERWELAFSRIMDFIGLYAETEEEARKMGNTLLDCHNAYKRMLNNNNLIKDYEKTEIKAVEYLPDGKIEPKVIDLSDELSPLDFIRQNGKEGMIETELFVGQFDEQILNKLVRNGDVYSPRANLIKILE